MAGLHYPHGRAVIARQSCLDPLRGLRRQCRGDAEADGKGSVYQDVTGLESGRNYVVSAWVSGAPGDTATAEIAVYDGYRNVATFGPTVASGTGWAPVTHSFQATSSGTIRIHLFRNEGTGVIYWDDVQISILP
jgi:hypothetical protein